MTKHRHLLMVVALAVLISRVSIFADDSKLIRVGKGDWCPYVCEAKNADGKPGYAAEMIQAIFEKAGYRVEFVSINYTRGIDLAREGKHAIMACMYQEDAPDLVFPKTPLGVSVNRFFVSDENPWRFKGLSSLSGVRVGLIQSYVYPEFQEYIDSHPGNFEFLGGPNPLYRLLKMVSSGRIDATFDDRNVLVHQTRKLDPGLTLVDAGGFDITNDVLIGFSPVDPRTPALIAILEEGIHALRTSGELTEILERYSLMDWKAPDVAP